MIEAIINDNWYVQNPEKILGQPYLTTGRYTQGEKTITKYRGTFEDVMRIPGVAYEAANMLSPHISSEHSDTFAKDIHIPQQRNIKRALKKAKKEKSARDQAKAGELDLITFDEIDQLYNKHLTDAQKEVFVWYQTKVLGRAMEGGWKKYYNPAALSKKVVPLEWAKQELVYWFGDGFLPAFIYLSGNIAERREMLGQDQPKIESMKDGKAIFERQSAALGQVWNRVTVRRKRLDAERMEDRLIIKPVSNLAKSYTIRHLKGEVRLKAKIRQNGQIDYSRALQRGIQQELKEPISLQGAFVLWMSENARELGIRRGLTWRSIKELYLESRKRGKDEDVQEFKRNKSAAQQEGIRLFSDFLAKAITDEDRQAIERIWNERYNSEVPVDLDQVPIGFTMARIYNGMEMDIRPEKREAVAFAQIRGAGCLAYGVGLGKTWCAIFIAAQFLENGWCKRPFFVLPNQVYKQFMGECRGILPHIPQNDLYNLSEAYLENIPEEGPMPEGSITFLTYQGFKRVGLDDMQELNFFGELMSILDQEGHLATGKAADKAYERLKNKVGGLIGVSQMGARANIDRMGLDMMVVDEAHSAKKIFTTVKAEEEENLDNEKRIKRYDISSGEPSAMGLKTFMIAQYVQKVNPTGNVLLLTATPFTNSPMEIYSMISLVGLRYLQELQLKNLKQFFDQFVNTSNELVFTIALNPEFKDVFVGFSNLDALQSIIRRFFLYKQSTKNLKRPNKIVLPLRRKVVNGMEIRLGGDETIETVLPFNAYQKERMDSILAYAAGQISVNEACQNAKVDSDDNGGGVRMLRAAGMARKVAFSPYILECDEETKNPGSPKAFIESSAKLEFITGCIRSVKAYHEQQGSPMSGQIIYSNMGVEFFPLLRDYLIEKVGFQPHEVGIIVSESRMKKMGFKDKQTVQNAFLGRRFNPVTRDYEDIPHEFRCKVLIGSATIREGINLQRYASCLYILELPWNPTDVNQLEGRLWRQGNIHRSVRIVNPLMEDSMDIFMFQKLEEKTARINAIWDFDNNQSTLDTRDFDPSELKYVLIKDPFRIAELEAKERSLELEDEIVAIDSQLTTLEGLRNDRYQAFNRLEEVAEAVSYYRGLPEGAAQDPDEMRRQVSYILRAKKLKDGRLVETLREEVERGYKISHYYRNPYEDAWIKPAGVTPPYWYSNWKKSVAKYNRAVVEILKPKGLDDSEEAIKQAVEQLQAEKEQKKKEKEGLLKAERLQERAEEIRLKKEAEGIAAASIEARVAQFAQLNYMLDGLRVEEPQESIAGEAADALYRAGETVGYAGKKARVEKAYRGSNGKLYYLVKQSSYVELALEAELSPNNATQQKRLQARQMGGVQKELPQRANTKTKILLAKARKRKKLKLLQLAA